MSFTNPAEPAVITVQPSPVAVTVTSAPAAVTVEPAAAAVNVSTPANITTTNLYGARLFGNGSDGSVTVSGYLALTRDMQYASLTVTAGGLIRTQGFRLMVAGRLENSGTIEAPGFTQTPAPSGSLLGGGQGGGLGAVGQPAPQSGAANVGGGAGGQSTSDAFGAQPKAGGAGGSGLSGLVYADTQGLASRSYTGGGGGGGGPQSDGGYGGGGAGVLAVFADELVNAGTIRANGGSGNATGSNGAGGGGGGGVVVLIYRTYSGNAAQALGGTGGRDSSGRTGNAGVPGKVAEVIIP